MARSALALLAACSTVASVRAAVPCNFADQFTCEQLVRDPHALSEFIFDVATMEGRFGASGVGVNAPTGHTYDGWPLNYTTGLLASVPHPFSAPSKEGFHLGVLARALDPTSLVGAAFVGGNVSAAVDVLTRKVATYRAWNQTFPGFGGFLPWVNVTATNLTLLDGWTNRVPALDNGEWFWGLVAVAHMLHVRGFEDVATQYDELIAYLVSTAQTVFYGGQGRVWSVVQIKDIYAPPTPANYQPDGEPTPGMLDDPYEGELFTFLIDLFGTWASAADREVLWSVKAPLLQAVNFSFPCTEAAAARVPTLAPLVASGTCPGNVTVQRGWWFSAHEQMKLLFLPYLADPMAQRVFTNCERARTLHAALNEIPGLYASVNDVATPNSIVIPSYIGATGIASIAFQTIDRTDVITPYGAFPLILVDPGMGACWYRNTLAGPRMQGPYGSTEAVNVNGTEISPLTTWDSKITNVLAFAGGVGDIVAEVLAGQRDSLDPTMSKLDRLLFVVHREHTRVFGGPDFVGEDVPLSMPTATVTRSILGTFPTCTA